MWSSAAVVHLLQGSTCCSEMVFVTKLIDTGRRRREPANIQDTLIIK